MARAAVLHWCYINSAQRSVISFSYKCKVFFPTVLLSASLGANCSHSSKLRKLWKIEWFFSPAALPLIYSCKTPFQNVKEVNKSVPLIRGESLNLFCWRRTHQHDVADNTAVFGKDYLTSVRMLIFNISILVFYSGGVLTLHGPIYWFRKNSYVNLQHDRCFSHPITCSIDTCSWPGLFISYVAAEHKHCRRAEAET